MTPAPCGFPDCEKPSAHRVSLKYWDRAFDPIIDWTMAEMVVCDDHRRGWAYEVRDNGAVILTEDEMSDLIAEKRFRSAIVLDGETR